jgi:predicted nucleic-acid-binding protein
MSEPNARAALDANVILRFLLHDNNELSSKADGILGAVERGEIEAHCDPATLAEAVWVLSSFYGIERDDIAAALTSVVAHPSFNVADKPRYLRALELYAGPCEHFGDACACATALDSCDGRIYSFDRRISGVTAIERREAVDA